MMLSMVIFALVLSTWAVEPSSISAAGVSGSGGSSSAGATEKVLLLRAREVAAAALATNTTTDTTTAVDDDTTTARSNNSTAVVTVVAMNDSAIVWSPYNWALLPHATTTSTAGNGAKSVVAAKTINPGAYFRVTVLGADSVALRTDTSHMPDMFSQFWTRVDGGPLVQHTLSPGNPTISVPLGPPYSATSNHLIEVIVKSTTETRSRWSPQATAVIFTGIELHTSSRSSRSSRKQSKRRNSSGSKNVVVKKRVGAAVAAPAVGKNAVGDDNAAFVVPSVRAPQRLPYNVLVYGDSITEGVRTLGYVGITNDTDRNDCVRDYSYQLGRLLRAEVGVVAFGATGTTKGGSGGVPALTTSWNMLWDGQSRAFNNPQPPDLVVYNEGTNDRANITSTLLQVVRGVASVAPNANQLLLVPFNGAHRDDIAAVVRSAMASGSADGIRSKGRVVLGDTSGFYDGADGLHPFGYNHVAEIAPRVAQLCAPLLT